MRTGRYSGIYGTLTVEKEPAAGASVTVTIGWKPRHGAPKAIRFQAECCTELDYFADVLWDGIAISDTLTDATRVQKGGE